VGHEACLILYISVQIENLKYCVYSLFCFVSVCVVDFSLSLLQGGEWLVCGRGKYGFTDQLFDFCVLYSQFVFKSLPEVAVDFAGVVGDKPLKKVHFGADVV